MPQAKVVVISKGGPGSGHHGHVGRPGKVGGSLPDKGGYAYTEVSMARLLQRPADTNTAAKVREEGWSNIMQMAEWNDMSTDEYVEKTMENVKWHLEECDIAVRVPLSKLDTILSEGHLKTWKESKESGGYLDSEYERAKMESQVLGVPLEAGVGERPIYGYFTRDKNGREANDTWLMQYGEVVLKLKPHIKDRSTFTDSDSLDYGVYSRLYPSPVNHPSIFSLFGVTNQTDVLHYWAPDSSHNPDNTIYWEAQIFGGVTLSDIDEIILPSAPTGSLKDLLDSSGVSWRSR